jgi:GrpB-like predicted nucleotidyltransferase (UPF0157 family)
MSNPEQIEIVPYRDEWPSMFKQVKLLLARSLQDIFVSVDHIGSTSVPGLRSKDRIDVQITVGDLSSKFKHELDLRLLAGGFPESRANQDHRPPGEQGLEASWFKLYVSGIHPALPFRSNIHIRKEGNKNWRYPLLFRDYLREHPDSAEAYARAKEKLAHYLAGDRAAYSDAKDPVCDLIMVEAERWANSLNWRPILEDRS